MNGRTPAPGEGTGAQNDGGQHVSTNHTAPYGQTGPDTPPQAPRPRAVILRTPLAVDYRNDLCELQRIVRRLEHAHRDERFEARRQELRAVYANDIVQIADVLQRLAVELDEAGPR